MLDHAFSYIEYYCECINLFLPPPLSSCWSECIVHAYNQGFQVDLD